MSNSQNSWSFQRADSAETPYKYSLSSKSSKGIDKGVFPLLRPYMFIGTVPSNQQSANPDGMLASTDAEQSADGAASAPVRRFALTVAPLYIQSMDTNRSSDTSLLLNFDTKDLYTDNSSTALSYFGTQWEEPTPTGDDCGFMYNDDTLDGVYTSPVPARGTPVKFQKVYFRGAPGGSFDTCNEDSHGYYAYFLCSSPIINDSPTGDNEGICDLSGYNPRNANWNYMEGVDTSWEAIDIAGGSLCGGGGCTTGYSAVAGTGYINDYGTTYYTTGFGKLDNNAWGTITPSGGCENLLIFSGNCDAVSSVEQIYFTEDNYPAVTGKYATVVKLFADYITTGVGLCLGNGDIVSGDILFRPYPEEEEEEGEG